MKEALVIVLDSVGIGHAPDAADFGDEGANTLGHLRETIPGFELPHLDEAGLIAAEECARGMDASHTPTFSWGCLTEVSAGKDTISGHWELAGAVMSVPFATFSHFPDALVAEMEFLTGVRFIGNLARSGTVILDEFGEEHLRTGHPILYTSADSVIQIAAHESVLSPATLYEICRECRRIADRENIGRVIARPFEGEPGGFRRTANRHDFSMEPPETVLNRLSRSGIETIGIGKIEDIFSGSGLNQSFPTADNAGGMGAIDQILCERPAKERLILANLVDFDSLYGHRRNPQGYASALTAFDTWLGTLIPRLSEDTLLIITADHGNDPTWKGTDHTRERVPLIVHASGNPQALGARETMADVGASLAQWFGVPYDGLCGTSFLGENRHSAYEG